MNLPLRQPKINYVGLLDHREGAESNYTISNHSNYLQKGVSNQSVSHTSISGNFGEHRNFDLLPSHIHMPPSITSVTPLRKEYRVGIRANSCNNYFQKDHDFKFEVNNFENYHCSSACHRTGNSSDRTSYNYLLNTHPGACGYKGQGGVQNYGVQLWLLEHAVRHSTNYDSVMPLLGSSYRGD